MTIEEQDATKAVLVQALHQITDQGQKGRHT